MAVDLLRNAGRSTGVIGMGRRSCFIDAATGGDRGRRDVRDGRVRSVENLAPHAGIILVDKVLGSVEPGCGKNVSEISLLRSAAAASMRVIGVGH